MKIRDDGGLYRLTEEKEKRILEVRSQDWVTDQMKGLREGDSQNESQILGGYSYLF